MPSSRLEDLATRGGGGGDVNILKSDAELQLMLKKLDNIKKYKKFQGWRQKFLDRLESFLYQEGMVPAQTACNEFDALLKKFVKMANKLQGFIDSGDLSNSKKTVKAALALNEVCNSLTKVASEVERLIPSLKREEKQRGFTKFHLGACLIRQGFHQYITMKIIADALENAASSIDEVMDRQQSELFAHYNLVVQRFCDVMADLGLYEVMLKCLEFAEEPEDESEDPEPINITIKSKDGKTKSMHLEVEVMDTISVIKDAIADHFNIAADRQVLSYLSAELDDNSKTVQDLEIADRATLTLAPLKVPVKINFFGKTFDVLIDTSEPMSAIKRQLEDLDEEIPMADNQKLSMNGIDLGDDDEQSADFYGIQAHSVLDLEPKMIPVNLELPNGHTAVVELQVSDTVDIVKKKIEAATGVPIPRQKLCFNEKPMEGTVRSSGVTKGSTIVVDFVKVPVTVRNIMNGGEEIQVMVDPFDTLGSFKKSLEEPSEITAENQCLKLNDLELVGDDETAGFFGIQEGTVLDLEPKSIQVSVQMPDGSTASVKIHPTDTCRMIKDKIAEETGMKPSKQVLFFNGKQLPAKGSTTAKEMGMQNGSTLKVEIFKVPVTVKTFNGKTIQVMVDPTDSLLAIKHSLENESGIPASNQNLFLEDDVLADDSKVAADYGIQEGSTLELEPKLIKINFQMPNGKVFAIDVAPSDNGGALKSKIETTTGLAATKQVLSFNGNPIKSKNATVRDLGAQEGDTINVSIFKVPVTVNTFNGKTINVMVDPTDTLGAIKKSLEDESGLPASNQNLFMNGDALTDDSSLATDYGIQEGSTLDLEPKSIKINFQMPNGKDIAIDVAPSDNTDALKSKIESSTGLAATKQVLSYSGNPMKSKDTTIRDLGAQEGDTINVGIFKVTVKVNTLDGRTINVMVDPTDTLGAIKKSLEDESGLPAGNQNLFLDGNELSDDKMSAEDYGIKAGSELDMEPKTMKVTAEMPDGSKQVVEVKPSDTTEQIKAVIDSETGMAIPRQVLTFDGKKMSEDSTVRDLGIQDGSTIKVDIFKVPITVQTMDGSHIKISVDPTDKLAAIKKQLETESDVPASNQNLFLNGERLEDDQKSAASFGIKAGSELELEPKAMNVRVAMPDGTIAEVTVKPSDGCDAIRDKISKQTGVESARQVLNFEGRNLSDPKEGTAKSMGLREGSTIQLDLFKIPITIKTKDGQSLQLQIEPIDNVDTVKGFVKSETGMAPLKQCLKFKEKELDNGRLQLSACGITAGDVLTVEPHVDPIIFIDVKSGSLFALDREEVIEKEILTTAENNKLDFQQASQGSQAQEKILKAILGSPNLGVATQVVVEKGKVDDYDLKEAEKLKNMWGVSLKKRQKNKEGEEFIFVDPKTGSVGELTRKTYIDKGVITPCDENDTSIEQVEKDPQTYDKYVADVRQVFGIQMVS